MRDYVIETIDRELQRFAEEISDLNRLRIDMSEIVEDANFDMMMGDPFLQADLSHSFNTYNEMRLREIQEKRKANVDRARRVVSYADDGIASCSSVVAKLNAFKVAYSGFIAKAAAKLPDDSDLDLIRSYFAFAGKRDSLSIKDAREAYETIGFNDQELLARYESLLRAWMLILREVERTDKLLDRVPVF